ncbi:HD-GYP domain-containing protein [Robertmurraya korlensis]|uniref:HD-GYP domain-containing protein n=1 Tax=Robertmurraya korlensis TaxID=519977 RepID=UPI000826623C|nr:HD-GYP domain-containing protein [Robertmurraya korlensis]
MNMRGNGIQFVKSGGYIKQSVANGSILNLLVQSKGFEVILHEVKEGHHWTIGPIEGWDGIEFIYLLSGSLSWLENKTKMIASTGDHLIMDPIRKDTFFTAIGNTTFLYVSTGPSFDEYNDQIKHFMNLAVAVEEKDGYTADHCQRIKDLSIKTGEKLGLSSEELYVLHIGSFLHDVGKTKIPDLILNKPSKLTNEEYEQMKKHTSLGANMLVETGIPTLKRAALIVEQHHERYNGTGYPYRLKGNEINLSSSIVGVVDSFDAMTSVRVYSRGRSLEDALEEVKQERERLFHPDVVDAFLSIMS